MGVQESLFMSWLLERRLDEMEFQPEKVLYEYFFDFGEVEKVLHGSRVLVQTPPPPGDCTHVENVGKKHYQPLQSKKHK